MSYCRALTSRCLADQRLNPFAAISWMASFLSMIRSISRSARSISATEIFLDSSRFPQIRQTAIFVYPPSATDSQSCTPFSLVSPQTMHLHPGFLLFRGPTICHRCAGRLYPHTVHVSVQSFHLKVCSSFLSLPQTLHFSLQKPLTGSY